MFVINVSFDVSCMLNYIDDTVLLLCYYRCTYYQWNITLIWLVIAVIKKTVTTIVIHVHVHTHVVILL